MRHSSLDTPKTLHSFNFWASGMLYDSQSYKSGCEKKITRDIFGGQFASALCENVHVIIEELQFTCVNGSERASKRIEWSRLAAEHLVNLQKTYLHTRIPLDWRHNVPVDRPRGFLQTSSCCGACTHASAAPKKSERQLLNYTTKTLF